MEQAAVKIALDVQHDLEVRVHNGHMLGTLLIDQDGLAYRKPNRRRTTALNRLSWEVIDSLAQADPATITAVSNLLNGTPTPQPAPEPEPVQVPTYPRIETSTSRHYHQRRECQIWLVSLHEMLDRKIWQSLCKHCRTFGGWWCHRYEDKPGGFAFMNPVDAGNFAAALGEGLPTS